MDALGTHLLLDLRQCNSKLLDDIDYIKQCMLDAALEARATVLGDSFHKFDPHGVTGIVAVAESHLCIHTWPEHGYAAADIFTCGSEFKADKAADLIIRLLQCGQPRITKISRGLLPELGTSAA